MVVELSPAPENPGRWARVHGGRVLHWITPMKRAGWWKAVCPGPRPAPDAHWYTSDAAGFFENCRPCLEELAARIVEENPL